MNKEIALATNVLTVNVGAIPTIYVAREIFEVLESKKIFLKDHAGNMGIVIMLKDVAELKKKYIGEDINAPTNTEEKKG